jgi:type IV secretory pathway ATPase VirB11/archaellum biosynthesis ATPase
MAAELPAVVPGPVPPDDRDAWYAPDIRAQYAVAPGVVATVTETGDGFRYETREPPLSVSETATSERIATRFADSPIARPRTREGAIDRMEAGLPAGWTEVHRSLAAHSAGGRRRLEYHLGARLRALGALTPLALDGRIRIGDSTTERLTVHTDDFAPAITELSADTPHLDRFLSERVDTAEIPFESFEIPVTIVRRHLLGADRFDTTYVVDEPDRLPGDRAIIESVQERLMDAPPGTDVDDHAAVVIERARKRLQRRLALRDSAQVVDALARPVRKLLERLGIGHSRPRSAPHTDRVDDLAYYVARDLVGDGALTVPMRDPRLRSIEANRVGERVKIVPQPGAGLGTDRMPTTTAVDDEDRFLGLARSIAAEGGVELSTHRPRATVTISRSTAEGEQDVHASVALPVGREDGAHISMTKERATAQSPVELVERDVLAPRLVATIWTVAANRGRIVFVGPPSAEPEAVLAAQTPFIPTAARPVAVEREGNPVDLPQETAVTVPQAVPNSNTGETPVFSQPNPTPLAALQPDVVVHPDLVGNAAMKRLESVLAAGRGLLGAAQAEDRDRFATRVIDTGLSPSLVDGIDLVVELPPADSDARADGWIPIKSEGTDPIDAGVDPGSGSPESALEWQPFWESKGADGGSISEPLADRLLDTSVARATLAAAVERRTRYVEFLRRESMTDRAAVMGFLSDLRTDEAATVERIRRTLDR